MRLVRLSGVCACEAKKPLTELRLFKAGPNETSKGTFTFDDIAAQSVMASYAKAGVQVMFDLEHLSLDSHSPNYNPDAMGWCDLELRTGELWAANIKWTSAGNWRLLDKSQRYLSPAFAYDASNRVTELVNIALVAMPATYEAQQLIAASRRAQLSTENSMDPELIKAALEALIAGDAETCAELLKAIIITATTGETATPEDAAGDTPAATDAPMAATEQANVDVSGMNLILASLLKSTGANDPTEALQIVENWGKAQVEVLSQKAGLELASRRMLIADLVKLGVETPATAWEGDDKTLRIPVKRLSAEPLEELRARVKTLATGIRPTPPVRPNTTSIAELSDKEKAGCKAQGISEAEYLKRKTALLKRSTWNAEQQTHGVDQ